MGNDPDKVKCALDAIAFFLSRRDHSEKELRLKLQRRYDPDTIERALSAAHERKWLADPHVLAERIANRLHSKGRGRLYIENYLKKRGLGPTSRDEEREIEKGRDLLQTKFHKTDGFSFEERVRATRFLLNRGFERAIIRKIIHEKQ